MKAAIAYLRALRQGRKLTQPLVAREAIGGVDGKQVYRWEKTQYTPSIAEFAAYMRVVDGDWAHVGALLYDAEADEQTAQALAKARIAASFMEGDGALPESELRRRIDTTYHTNDSVLERQLVRELDRVRGRNSS